MAPKVRLAPDVERKFTLGCWHCHALRCVLTAPRQRTRAWWSGSLTRAAPLANRAVGAPHPGEVERVVVHHAPVKHDVPGLLDRHTLEQ